MRKDTNKTIEYGALFVDFDNIYIALINQFNSEQSEAQSKIIDIINNVLVHIRDSLEIMPIFQHITADWTEYSEVLNGLYLMGFDIGHVKAVTRKNSADIEISLKLLETMLIRDDLTVFIIVAGDRDYLPIARRVREKTKEIIFYSFKECLSGDIKRLVGDYNYFYIDPENGRIDDKVELKNGTQDAIEIQEDIEMKKESKADKTTKLIMSLISYEGITIHKLATETRIKRDELLGHIQQLEKDGVIVTVKKGRWTKVIKLPQLTYDQQKALISAIKAEDEYAPKYGDVKLTGFMNDMLEKALASKSHIERKEIFQSLVDMNLIKLKNKENWGGSFTVFNINRDHPLVKKNIEKREE